MHKGWSPRLDQQSGQPDGLDALVKKELYSRTSESTAPARAWELPVLPASDSDAPLLLNRSAVPSGASAGPSRAGPGWAAGARALEHL